MPEATRHEPSGDTTNELNSALKVKFGSDVFGDFPPYVVDASSVTPGLASFVTKTGS
jgi:hypothetical protein